MMKNKQGLYKCRVNPYTNKLFIYVVYTGTLVCRQAYSSMGKTKQIERRAESVGVRAQENRHVAGVHIFQDLVDLVLRIINIVDIGCVYVRSDLDFLAGTISAIALRSVTPVTT